MNEHYVEFVSEDGEDAQYQVYCLGDMEECEVFLACSEGCAPIRQGQVFHGKKHFMDDDSGSKWVTPTGTCAADWDIGALNAALEDVWLEVCHISGIYPLNVVRNDKKWTFSLGFWPSRSVLDLPLKELL